ncbi:MAG: Na+:solute symporter [Candidatus Eisenbacteria bacterium]|uniref:Na+:solute symporter n=1 Tax=Eiseniibacteriota bacterium TaxID=2212470 RepID=A0A948S016_UNCEI|nr:Na+:solute symporter [Candidatus Eisenbacteria bacterium]MBU1948134.1 Na+:solute symporter [Candidatus Eisenbacteria bacterium]MBU2692729.1 Na+:solute symporter [Candidatus Eisenbacteria bacterium]
MNLVTLDWLILALYAILVLGIGIFYSRRASRNTEEFFLSGRQLPWWIAGTSMVATTFAADTPLVVTAYVRSGGVTANWIWFNFAISHALTTFFLAALWRRARVVTDVEFCELRYGSGEGAFLRGFKGGFYSFVTNSVVLGWVILAMATISEEVLGFPKLLTIGACILLATVYASLSGLWGVVMTDLFQFCTAMLGSILLMVLAIDHVGGLSGFAKLIPSLMDSSGEPAMRMMPPVFRGPGAAKGVFWGFIVAISIQWWSWKYSDGGGVLIQRMSASKNERHATLSMLWFSFLNYAVRPWPWFVVALVSIAVFPDLTDHKAAYPKMMSTFLGPGWLGLMFAAMLAAFMSTIDTHMNLASSYFVNDIYRRFMKRNASERHYLWISRASGLGFLIIGSLIALFNTSIRGLFEFLLQLVSGAGAVFLFRWFWWRLNAWSELSAMISSLTVATLLNLSNRWGWIGHTFASHEIMAINVFLSGLVWLTVSYLTKPTPWPVLEAFYKRTRPPGLWRPVRGRFRKAETDDSSDSYTNVRHFPTRQRWEGVLLALILIYGALFGLGHILYGHFLRGGLLCLLGVASFLRIRKIPALSGNGQHSGN